MPRIYLFVVFCSVYEQSDFFEGCIDFLLCFYLFIYFSVCTELEGFGREGESFLTFKQKIPGDIYVLINMY